MNKCVLRRRRNMDNDSADVTSSGRSFHVCGPATGKARLPTVASLLVGTTRRLAPTERSDRRLAGLGRSATHVKGLRYPGTSCFVHRTFATTGPSQNSLPLIHRHPVHHSGLSLYRAVRQCRSRNCSIHRSISYYVL